MKVQVVAFDVNETLLDLSGMATRIDEATRGRVAAGEWFGRLLHRTMLANQFRDGRTFEELGAEALLWLASRSGADLDPAIAADIVDGLADLPAHSDVAQGLERLADRGIRMVAVTNGSLPLATRQLEGAGLARFLETILSVESVGRFKPAPEVYSATAARGDVDVAALMLVAAHDWDVVGAQAAGARGCFVRRTPWGMGGFQPDHEVADLGGLAKLEVY